MGFAGTTDGSFFRPPPWVDRTRPPGTTSQASSYGQRGWWTSLITGTFLFYSPNLVWLIISIAVYLAVPYDYGAAETWSPADWVLTRLAVNVAVVFSYFGFWHVVLYLAEGWAERPFKPSRVYRRSKILHNAWYTLLGCVQWTAWECAIAHCHATGRLPYLPDSAAFATWSNAINVALCCFWVPLYREVHFYFAHRLLHIKCLYKYVHSVHHRNTDVEPFAGLSMHPVEHLYYFSCVAPCLFFVVSPFATTWMGMHALISPAASHSGWEDHFQSDQFHYLHHRFFECNYGTIAIPFDRWFGTFRDRLPDPTGIGSGRDGRSGGGGCGGGGDADGDAGVDDDDDDGGDDATTTYRGAGGVVGATDAAKIDAGATLLGKPDGPFAAYMTSTVIIFGILGCATLGIGGVDRWTGPFGLGLLPNGPTIGALVAVGPVAAGAMLLAVTTRDPFSSPARMRMVFLYPFHKERLFGAFGVNALLGLIVTVVPVFVLVSTVLSPPGEAYCPIWGDC